MDRNKIKGMGEKVDTIVHTLLNVKPDNDSCRLKYTCPSFFLYDILTLSCSKVQESIFLSVFTQMSESAVEIKFSSLSGKQTLFPRIFELRTEQGVFDISK